MKNLKSSVGIGMLCMLMGCAHSVKPVKISNMANPNDEIATQNLLMEQAYTAQIDVLAPEHFSDAKKYLSEAKDENKKGAPSEEILESLGYAKSHLLAANKEASHVQGKIPEITAAREKAVQAGARKLSDELKVIDEKLIGFTHSSPLKMTPDEKSSLQNKYLELELASIKHTHLHGVKKVIHLAEDKGAEKITPKAYSAAIQKYNAAEKLIETDRHSTAQIKNAVAAATVSANRVLTLLESEQISRSQTPEQRAMTLESRDLALKQSNAVKSAVVAQSIEKDQELAIQGQALAVTEDENSELKKKEKDDMIVRQAAAQFNANEADVYRQDGVLIIRLKSMNFSSGRSDLPASSIAVLTKVKDVIKEIGPGEITVEGHTDGVGAAMTNQQLSEKRAESVLKFFTADEVLENNKMDSVGYGYSKPLGTNKTKEGRAQNRRVDILIRPNQAI